VISRWSHDFLNAIALFAALTIALGVPAGYATIRAFDEIEMLTLRTQMNAGRVGKMIYVNEATWRFQAVRIAELIEHADFGSHPVRQRLYDATGRTVLAEEGDIAWPSFAVRVPIVIADRTAAILEARTSQRPLWLETAFVALAAGSVGFGAWLAVRLLPLRALNRAMLQLVEQTARGQIAEREAALMREQKRVEAEANAAKTGFLAMMSHEIRTPMNAVLGLAGSLLDDDLTAEQRQVVEAIRESGDDLLRLLNDILDFSKLEANRMTFEAAPFSPAALTDSVISILGSRAAAKGLAVRTDLDPTLPIALLGDAGRVRQVLVNLVSNAIKFTPTGQVVVRARCVTAPGDRATIEWEVSDTGIGIAADRIARLFNEFTQADSSITRRFGGTGLGLAICKRLVSQMDGSISVESTPGVGTTFRARLSLPVAAPTSRNTSPPTSAVLAFRAALAAFGRKPRLLFAEDNPTNQFVARQLLKDLDIQVDVVGDGQEAVDAATRLSYDVICMDVQMPEMDGLEATRMIRALPEPARLVPIIALTANAFPEDVHACYEAGMNQFVSKPVNRETLLAALARALSRDGIPADAPAEIVAATETAEQ
jgi:signal transduction histidine kinase/ActR/RegA family two-component response regulator